MREKPLRRRTPWLSRITNEREFRHREELWLWDRISDLQYLTACHEIEQVRRLRKLRPSPRVEMSALSVIGTTSERGSSL